MNLDDLQPIPVFTGVDKARFEAEIQPLHKPAILKGLASDWPIVAKASESGRALTDYIERFEPGRPVKAFFASPDVEGRYFYNDDLTGFNFRQRELPLAELLGTLRRHEDDERPPSVYAGAIQLTGRLEALRDANHHALLDEEMEQLVSIWIGNRGKTAIHWDLPQNIACVVAGERRFTLFPPEQLPNLYIGPLDVTLAGQPVSLVDLNEPDLDRFPNFSDALEAAQTAVMEPGDAIYVPSMWFHHVQNMSALGVLLNFWWRDAAPHMFTPLFTMFHALLSIRDLPADEREHWKRMFDFYIFREDGDPMPHVPEHARGVFQDMTPERVVALRNFLVHKLGGELRRDK